MQRLLPSLNVVLWAHDCFDANDVIYALVWDPPFGFFDQFPNLKFVFSAGAGVGHILNDPSYPAHVPIVRAVGQDLRQRMGEFLALHTLRAHKKLPDIERSHFEKCWTQHITPVASAVTVGIMGLGNMGLHTASILKTIGYRVIGWVREPRSYSEFELFVAREQLSDFLKQTNILICLLPLTVETENILNAAALSVLPIGSYLINVGRGEHIDDNALVNAINSGHLTGATLDVFRNEPLPKNHFFWDTRGVVITCHTACSIEPEIAAEIIAKNIHRCLEGMPPEHVVDMAKGY